jgi:hypothetical protein
MTPEERLAALEWQAKSLVEQMGFWTAHAAALQELLAERGVIPEDEVRSRVARNMIRDDEALELEPRWRSFREWRRRMEGRGPAPDDQDPNEKEAR